MNSNDEEIRKLAHQIWESEGRPEGKSDKHWEQATILVEGLKNPDQTHPKRSVDPSETPGPFEPHQPDQT